MPVGAEFMYSRLTLNDLLAIPLTLILALNLNGVFNLWIGVNQAFSGAIFFLSVALTLNVAKRELRVTPELLFFIVSITLYLVFGTIYYSHLDSVNQPERYLRAYASSLLVVFALSIYLASLSGTERFFQYLGFVRILMLVAAFSVLFSPLLYLVYANPPLSAGYRMGGFFANPNEAAMVGLMAFILIIGMPFKSKVVQSFAVLASAVAVVLTFSKTGILLLLLFVVLYVFLYARLWGRVFLSVLIVFSLSFFIDPSLVLHSILNNTFFELDQSQQSRVRVMFSVITGDLSEDISTGRSFLWGFALNKVLDTLPSGSGLGSMHHMVGGLEEFGVWQGAHNALLMMIGESGFVPFLFLIASLLTLIARLLRLERMKVMVCSVAFVLFAEMMVTHGALAVRYHNLMLAVLFGIAIAARNRAWLTADVQGER